MLTIYTLKSASEAFKYYQKDNYYAKEGETEFSEWFGKGAQILGLEGGVALEKFEALLEGRLPNNETMMQAKNGLHHRPGYDLTFSAPKSVSILGIVGGDERVINAHREAIKEVLTRIESEFAAYRAKDKGKISIQKTGNMTFATFEHHDSRALDPNLHTHCILMNMTQREDGAWRTIFGDELYNNKLLNGMHYRVILAEKLLSLGYNIVQTSHRGTFELEGFEQNVIHRFSKRRQQIKDKLTDMGLSGGKAAKVANFETRPDKIHIEPEQIKLAWEHELKACGKSLEWLQECVDRSKVRGPITLRDPAIRAAEAVNLAIPHLTSIRHVFNIQEIIKAAKGLSILPGGDFDLLKAIENKIEKNELLYVGKGILTTIEARELELTNISMMRMDKGRVNPISMSWVAGFIAERKLNTDSQREALKLMLTTQDREILISSQSKVMLEEVLKQFNSIVRGKNYYARGLTQNINRVETLKEKMGFGRAATIEGFLKACEIRAEKGNHKQISGFGRRQAREIWVVDSPMSLMQVNQLQRWSQYFGTRIIFTQLSNTSVPALASLLARGIANQTILDGKEQKLEKTLKENLLIQIKHREIEKSIQEIPNNKARIELGAEMVVQDITKSRLISLTNAERMSANDIIREKLKDSLTLRGREYIFKTLQAVPLTPVQKTLTHLYQKGDIILFKKERPDYGLGKENYFTVVEVDLKKETLLLKDRENKVIALHPGEDNVSCIEVFRGENRPIMEGDIIAWTRTLKNDKDKSLNRVNGERAIVELIEDEKVTVILQNGKKSILNTINVKEQHWDYGYAHLLNSKTSMRDTNVLLVNSNFVDNQTAHYFYDFLHMNKKAQIICDDIELLKNRIEQDATKQALPLEFMVKPYKREEALVNSAQISPGFLFPRMQMAYYNIVENDKELKAIETNMPTIVDAYTSQFRMACEKIDYICTKYAEREAVFSLKAVMDEVFQFDGLRISEKLLEQGFEKAINDGWLIVIKKEISLDTNLEETFVTTKDTSIMEQACINNMLRGKNACQPLMKMKDGEILKSLLGFNSLGFSRLFS